MSRLGEYMRAPEPAQGPRKVEEAPDTRRGDPKVAGAFLATIRAILKDSHPGIIAGSFQHAGGRGDIDPKEWAKVLRVREAGGEPLTIVQMESWREALGLPRSAPAEEA